jgi:hypothetical protein
MQWRQNQKDGQEHTIFIVVVIPVEEIGRNHDFDWSVIEFSNSQSIVQTAGRITSTEYYVYRERHNPTIKYFDRGVGQWHYRNGDRIFPP